MLKSSIRNFAAFLAIGSSLYMSVLYTYNASHCRQDASSPPFAASTLAAVPQPSTPLRREK